jgi:hypothetical protein
MDFEVYCDESCLEALTNKNAHKYTAIGGIWIYADKRDALKEGLLKIKKQYGINSEFKWNKVSPMAFDFYKAVLDFFFQCDFIRFRVIIIEASKSNEYKFHNSDVELAFYKYYYQLLQHWVFDFNNYNIFLDLKVNRNKGRLNELAKILNNSNLFSTISQVQGLPSHQSLGIQLADFLTGLVAAKFNAKTTSKAKLDLINYVESKYLNGNIIKLTSKTEEKFNVFVINLQGGW